jgi:hypothetical protein
VQDGAGKATVGAKAVNDDHGHSVSGRDAQGHPAADAQLVADTQLVTAAQFVADADRAHAEPHAKPERRHRWVSWPGTSS